MWVEFDMRRLEEMDSFTGERVIGLARSSSLQLKCFDGLESDW